MAACEAYIDESGTHDSSEVTIVGGVFAKKSCWLSLEGEWRAILKKAGVEAFHATDLNHFQGEFGKSDGWDIDKRDWLYKKLYSAIGKVKPKAIPFGVGLRRDLFDAVAQDHSSMNLTPYHVCTEWCVGILSGLGKRGNRIPPIDIVFESGQKWGTPEMVDIIALLNSEDYQNHVNIRSITMANKNDRAALQFADLVVYEIYQHHKSITPQGNQTVRDELVMLNQQVQRPVGGMLSEEAVRLSFEQGVKFRASLPKGGKKLWRKRRIERLVSAYR